MKMKPLFSTEQLLRGEVTRDMAKAAGGFRKNIKPLNGYSRGSAKHTAHRAPGARSH